MTFVEIIQNALSFLSGQKAIIARLKEELDASNKALDEQAEKIEDLRAQVAEDEVDDAALEVVATNATNAAQDATQRAYTLQAEILAMQQEADKLSAAINENPEIPIIDAKL